MKAFSLLKHRYHWLTGLLAVTLQHPTQALEYNIDLFADSEYSSNGRLDDSSRSEVTTNAGLGLSASENNRHVEFRGDYRAQYSEYENNTSRDRSQIRGSSDFIFNIIDDRFDWLASHNISEELPDRTASDIADNRERRQEYSTGPFISLPVTGVDHVTLTANHTRLSFDDAENDALNIDDADSESNSASVSWQHALSTITTLITGYQYQEFERDDAGQKIDFDRAYLGFSRALRTLKYNLLIGTNSSKVEGNSSSNGVFYQADISKTSGPQTFSASAARQRTESSLGITRISTDASLPTPSSGDFGRHLTFENSEVRNTVDITFFDIDYQTTAFCNRCSYGFEYSHIDSDYELLDEDDRVNNLHLFYNYKITRHLTADINGKYSHIELLNNDQEDKETQASLYFTWEASRQLSIGFGGGYRQEKRDGGRGNYYEGYGSVSVDYKLLASGR